MATPAARGRTRKTKRTAKASRARSVITTAPAGEPIVYRIGMANPGEHEFAVELHVPALPDRPTVELVFPAWAPGSYMIRDFVRHVYELAITDARGTALAAERLDKQRWRVASGGAPFVVRYRVFAFEATVRTSFLDDSHAYWNGTSVFFAVEGEAQRRCLLQVAAPEGWHISTGLPAVRPPRNGRRGAAGPARLPTFAAQNYDELVDSPFEVGTHQIYRFDESGAAFELALYGRCNADRQRLVDILRRVVRATAAIFGGLPFQRYVFIVHALPAGSGGLEHADSVTMDIAGLSFEDDRGYVRFADLAAHEFFHAWNVKRLHDPLLGPFDYQRETYTRLLWFHEGFTDYLANVIILRAGVIDEDAFWRWIAEDWPKFATRPGRNQTPLDELSFEAWIKQYKPAENYVNRAVSYYEKGLWVGMALDLTLRLATGGRRGLPQLFRRLWDRAGRRAAPVTEADVRAAARALAGRSLDGFFERYIHGTDELPLPALLRRAGVNVTATPAWSPESGESDAVKRERARAWSGVSINGEVNRGERAVVRNVIPGSPAAVAGLTFNDEVIALDGDRVNAATFPRRLADRRPGDRVTVSYFRRDLLRQTTLTVAASPERKLRIGPTGVPAERTLIRRWLHD